MNKLFAMKFSLFCLLIVHSFSFTLAKQDIIHPLFHKEKQILGQCSSDQINLFYFIINSCEAASTNQQINADCIRTNLKSYYKQQSYGVYLQGSSAVSGVSYWYKDCSITLQKYGRYNRTYRIWKSISPSSQIFEIKNVQKNLNKQQNQKQFKNEVQILGACSSSRISAVSNVLSLCNADDVQNSVECIKNQLNFILRQYWNAFGKGDYSIASVSSLSADDCSLSYRSYGPYMRTYVIWKTA